MRLYGQTFSKEDHIYFIKTIYQTILIPGLELSRVSRYANVLSALLKLVFLDYNLFSISKCNSYEF